MTFRGYSRLLQSSQLLVRCVSGICLLVLFAIALSFGTFKSHHTSKATSAATVSSETEGLANELVPHGPELQDVSVVHHGRIIEVKGTTDPGAIVMINGEPAATFFDRNTFKHFVGPMRPGTSILTITAQNDRGGVTTRQLAVQTE